MSRISPFLAAAFLLSFATPGCAKWQSIGPVKVSKVDANQVTFTGPRSAVTVTALAPGVIRVRMTARPRPKTDYSWAVVKRQWKHFPVTITGTPKQEDIRTPELDVRASLHPFRLAFYTRDGWLISQDDPDLGMARDGSGVRVWKTMPSNEQYFGLGEKGGRLDKRGHSYVMWNTDAAGWGATTDPLYEDVPFFLALRSGKAYGIFFDNTYRSSFDFGATFPNRYSFGAAGGNLNYYFFYGPAPKSVIEEFTALVGRTPLPPRWSLGYQQSRYSYYPAKMVRFIANNFRLRDIPCDVIYLDIHYMNGYRVFTWNHHRFPHPRAMIAALRKQGFRVVTILDPGIKLDPNYWVYQQGIAGHDFVTLPDGKVYVGDVWPGASVFPDFTSPRVRDWWGTLYRGLVSDGVSGFWNDMNEPSIFNSASRTMPLDAVFYDHGLESPQAKIHNVFGMQMSRGTRDGVLRLRPNRRPFVLTRATYAGGQRYAAVWTGDNSATWQHLRISIREILNMGLSGLAFAGADIGGFAKSPTPDLYTRWLEAGIFYPLCRTHTNFGTAEQDPWSYGIRRENINRRSIDLRYRLLPYLYNAFYQSSQTGLPIMRALLLDYPDDPEAVAQQDEFLFGSDFLVAPVVRDGARAWRVYLPEGKWFNFWNDRFYDGKQTVRVNAPLGRIPLFVRGGAIVPTQQVVQYTGQAPIDPLTFLIYPDGNSSSEYYEDDGSTLDYQHGDYFPRRISVEQTPSRVSVQISARQGSYQPPARSLVLKIFNQRHSPKRVLLDGSPVARETSLASLKKAATGWFYDSEKNAVWLRFPDHATAITAQFEK